MKESKKKIAKKNFDEFIEKHKCDSENSENFYNNLSKENKEKFRKDLFELSKFCEIKGLEKIIGENPSAIDVENAFIQVVKSFNSEFNNK
jgi:hypothetical protein